MFTWNIFPISVEGASLVNYFISLLFWWMSLAFIFDDDCDVTLTWTWHGLPLWEFRNLSHNLLPKLFKVKWILKLFVFQRNFLMCNRKKNIAFNYYNSFSLNLSQPFSWIRQVWNFSKNHHIVKLSASWFGLLQEH